MQPRQRLQRNLFEKEPTVPDVPAAQRSVLVRLIERLLVEARASDGGEARAATPETKEAAHEQDHA